MSCTSQFEQPQAPDFPDNDQAPRDAVLIALPASPDVTRYALTPNHWSPDRPPSGFAVWVPDGDLDAACRELLSEVVGADRTDVPDPLQFLERLGYVVILSPAKARHAEHRSERPIRRSPTRGAAGAAPSLLPASGQ